MQVLQVKSKKGGVGKSLFAREIAQALSALGLNVVLADCSEQANDDILENQQRPFPYTLKECIISGVPLGSALRQVRKHLWLLAGSRDHEDINTFIRKERYQDIIRDMIQDFRATLEPEQPFDQRFSWWKEDRIGIQLFRSEPTTDEEFSSPPLFVDYIIIDSDASTEDDLTFVLWEVVDGILIPYEPTELDWQSYYQLRQDLEKRYRRRPDQKPPILGILPNKVLHTKDNPTPLIYLQAMYRDAEERVFQTVHWSKIFGEALNQHIGGIEHPSYMTDRAIREICSIALELIGYQGELKGLKFCDKCTEALTKAMEEQQRQQAVLGQREE